MESSRLFVIAFALNLAWEMVQMRAYAGISWISLPSSAICSAAAIGDSTYILLLYWAGHRLSADKAWISRITPIRLLVILAVGFLVAVTLERIALLASLWQYASSMPRIPGIQVGLWPVLQLMTLPLAAFWVASRWERSSQR